MSALEHESTVEADDATELFTRHSPGIYRYCLRRLGSPEEAEDALQLTYLNAWRSLKSGFKPDQRDYGIGVQILRSLGVRSMRLLSNNPRKMVAIEGYGLSVIEWLPLEIPASEHTRKYLKTKKDKLGHRLDSV